MHRLVTAALEGSGFAIRWTDDVPGGRRVLADSDELAASVVAYAEVAGRPPAQGGTWVRVAVAVPDPMLAWSVP